MTRLQGLIYKRSVGILSQQHNSKVLDVFPHFIDEEIAALVCASSRRA